MKKGLTARNVLATKFNTLGFDGVWRDAVGDPQLTGSWIDYGVRKTAKTTFAMMLSKYLSGFGPGGLQQRRGGQFANDPNGCRPRRSARGGRPPGCYLDRESKDELCERLRRQRSADIVFIDSVQFMDLKFSEYKDLKRRFPHEAIRLHQSRGPAVAPRRPRPCASCAMPTWPFASKGSKPSPRAVMAAVGRW